MADDLSQLGLELVDPRDDPVALELELVDERNDPASLGLEVIPPKRGIAGEVGVNLAGGVERGVWGTLRGAAELGDTTDRFLQSKAGRFVANMVPGGWLPSLVANTGPVEDALRGARSAVRNFAMERSDIAGEFWDPDPARAGGWQGLLVQDVPQGLGSFAPAVVASVATGGSSLPIMAVGVLQGAAQGAEDAQAHGATQGQSDASVAINAAMGLTEGIGLGRVPGRFLREVVKRSERSVSGRVVRDIFEEVIQNPSQQLVQNVVARDIARYDEERPRSQGVGRAALVGGLTAGVAAGSVNVAGVAVDAIAPKPVTLEHIENTWADMFGEESVKRLNDQALQITTPDGRNIVVELKEPGSQLRGRASNTSFFESVEAREPRAAAKALKAANGDKNAAGAALRLEFGESGLTSTGVELSDPKTGASVKADALIELVEGSATRGTMSEENLHAILKLTGLEAEAASVFGSDEKIAAALEFGVDHPILNTLREFGARIRNALRPADERVQTPYQVAREMERLGIEQITSPADVSPQPPVEAATPQTLKSFEELDASQFEPAPDQSAVEGEPVGAVEPTTPPVEAATQELPEVGTAEDAGFQPLETETPQQTMIADHPVVEVPVADVQLSKDVPNFKAGADERGVVAGRELQGKYQRLGTAPIVVWERQDGTKEVITGRHRLELATRTGERTIPAQIVREADGFTQAMAMQFDAEANIRDDQGKVFDYATYFRNSNITQDEASGRGLLARDKGRKGFSIGKNAEADLFALFADGKITAAKAAEVADGAPGNAELQGVALRYALADSRRSADDIANYIRAIQAVAPDASAAQLDLFGRDEAWQVEADKLAKAASSIKDELLSERQALSAASKLGRDKYKQFRARFGVDPGDAAAIAERSAAIDQQIDSLSRWHTDPALGAVVRERAGLNARTDAVTYDDAGDPIPLSERFADASANIRYAVRRRSNAELRMHRTNERLIASPAFSEQAARVQSDLRAYYQPQTLANWDAEARAASPEERATKKASLYNLGAVESKDNNAVAIAAQDLMALAATDKQAATAEMMRLASSAGVMGQLLRQMSLVYNAVPEGMVMLADRAKIKATGSGLSESQRIDITSRAERVIRNKSAMMRAEELFIARPSNHTAARVESATEAFNDAQRRYQRAVAETIPKDWATIFKLLMQGNALTTRSLIANVVGNLVNNPQRFIAQTIAASTEGILYQYGVLKERTIAQPIATVGKYTAGFIGAMTDFPHTLWTGENRSRVIPAGEIQSGFHPFRAWLRMMSRDATTNERAKALVEATFGMPAEVTFRMLSIGDAPFYRGAYRKHLMQLGLTAGLRGQALELFQKAPPRDVVELAHERALEDVYQNHSPYSRAFSRFSNMGSRSNSATVRLLSAALWKPLMLFSATPANILYEAQDYLVPPVSVGKMLYHVSKGHQRAALMSFGKMATGIAMYAAAAALVRAGLVQGLMKDDDKQRDLAYMTFKPGHINLSGVKRLALGEDPSWRAGDRTISYRNLGIFGMVLRIVAGGHDKMMLDDLRMSKAGWQSDVEHGLVDSIVASAPGVLGATFDLAAMKGAYNLVQALADEKIDKWLPEYMKTITLVAIPNSLRSLNRAVADALPETDTDPTDYTGRAKAASTVRLVVNDLKTKLWMADQLPVKRDMMGRPISATPAGANPWVYNLMDVTNAQRITDDKYAKVISDVFAATGDRDVIPSRVTRDMRLGDGGPMVRLSDTQLNRFQELTGWFRMRAMDRYIEDPSWESVPDYIKGTVLAELWRVSRDAAKWQLAREMQTGLK